MALPKKLKIKNILRAAKDKSKIEITKSFTNITYWSNYFNSEF